MKMKTISDVIEMAEEGMNDARLIAAAPQMLAALKMVDDRGVYCSLDCATSYDEPCDCPAEDVERAVNEAIKAAEGVKDE